MLSGRCRKKRITIHTQHFGLNCTWYEWYTSTTDLLLDEFVSSSLPEVRGVARRIVGNLTLNLGERGGETAAANARPPDKALG